MWYDKNMVTYEVKHRQLRNPQLAVADRRVWITGTYIDRACAKDSRLSANIKLSDKPSCEPAGAKKAMRTLSWLHKAPPGYAVRVDLPPMQVVIHRKILLDDWEEYAIEKVLARTPTGVILSNDNAAIRSWETAARQIIQGIKEATTKYEEAKAAAAVTAKNNQTSVAVVRPKPRRQSSQAHPEQKNDKK